MAWTIQVHPFLGVTTLNLVKTVISLQTCLPGVNLGQSRDACSVWAWLQCTECTVPYTHCFLSFVERFSQLTKLNMFIFDKWLDSSFSHRLSCTFSQLPHTLTIFQLFFMEDFSSWTDWTLALSGVDIGRKENLLSPFPPWHVAASVSGLYQNCICLFCHVTSLSLLRPRSLQPEHCVVFTKPTEVWLAPDLVHFHEIKKEQQDKVCKGHRLDNSSICYSTCLEVVLYNETHTNLQCFSNAFNLIRLNYVSFFSGGQHGNVQPFSDEDASIETLSHCSSFSDATSVADEGRFAYLGMHVFVSHKIQSLLELEHTLALLSVGVHLCATRMIIKQECTRCPAYLLVWILL